MRDERAKAGLRGGKERGVGVGSVSCAVRLRQTGDEERDEEGHASPKQTRGEARRVLFADDAVPGRSETSVKLLLDVHGDVLEEEGGRGCVRTLLALGFA